MQNDFIWAILLFISGCVIIRQHKHIRENNALMDALSLPVEEIENFSDLLRSYGTIEDFINAHLADFNIFRSNVLKFYSAVGAFIDEALKLTSDLKNHTVDSLIQIRIDYLVESLAKSKEELFSSFRKFLDNETEAHQATKEVKEVLAKLDEEIKSINYYE